MDAITADDVRDLINSRAIDPAMVRYPDGSVEVRSTVPTKVAHLDNYRVIVEQQNLADIDGSGMDFDNLTDADVETLAESLTISDAEEATRAADGV